jgi:succinoglycan biosynthesis transport protein ExoP
VAQDGGGLPELVDALRWRWKLLLLVVVPLVAGATFYTQRLPNTYEAQAVVTVEPRPTLPSVGADIVSIDGPKYVAYITAPATIRRLASQVHESASDLDSAVAASLASTTGNITITATLGDPRRAAAVAQTFAEDLVSFSRIDPVVTVQLIAPPVVPDSPSGPPRRLMEGAAFLVALLLGVALTVGVERSRPRVRSWRDVAVLTGYPVIGRLPKARVLRRSSPNRALSDGAVGAAVRSLRTSLEREAGGQPRGVLVVTSPTPGEGKTTVAAVLATALARLELRVLLVDADLRRATLSRGLRVDGAGGLSGVLRGGADLSERILRGWTDGLSVLPTAPDPDAGDLLARRFGDVARKAREAYDVVVVDVPALLGTDDTATVATHADGVLLVVADGTMAGPVSESVLALHALRVRVWGVVANRVRDSAGSVSYSPAVVG